MDISSREVLFERSSLDHISPDESALPLPLGQAGIGCNSSTAWDYFHINSIAKGDDGNYLVSARHASTIYKINGTDGSIIWRLGGKASDFELGPNVTFGFQHHARFLPWGNETHDFMPLFDNSVYGSESAGGGDKEVRLYPYSRGKYIMLDHDSKKATLELAFLPPDDPILTKSQGSLQRLPQGNALINWGSEGQITEYTSDGEVVFHAVLDSGFLQDNLQNYRAFRYNWTGTSPETLAVFAEEVRKQQVDVYVSWNGDTRTREWKFEWDEHTRYGLTTRSVKATRAGFETIKRLPTNASIIKAIRVTAIDSDGKVLAVSEDIQSVRAYWLDSGKQMLVQENQQLVLGETL